MKIIIAVACAVAIAATAFVASEVFAMGFGREGVGFGKMGRVGLKKQSGGAPPSPGGKVLLADGSSSLLQTDGLSHVLVASSPNGATLLVDGTSFLLQINSSSKVCRAGGC